MVKKMAVLNKTGQCINIIIFDPNAVYALPDGFHLQEYTGQTILTQEDTVAAIDEPATGFFRSLFK